MLPEKGGDGDAVPFPDASGKPGVGCILPPTRQHRYPHLTDAEVNNLSSERGSDFPGATQLIRRSQGGLLMALKSLCSQPPVTLSLGEGKK